MKNAKPVLGLVVAILIGLGLIVYDQSNQGTTHTSSTSAPVSEGFDLK